MTDKLDLKTLQLVQQRAVEFARREWRAGEIRRSDAITDFLTGDIEDLLKQAEAQQEQQHQSFQQTLKNIQEAFQIMQTHCVGCTDLITEKFGSGGQHSYTVPVGVDADGMCKRCHKPRYKKP